LHARAPVKTSATARPGRPRRDPDSRRKRYTNDYPLGRSPRDAKVYEISAKTSEIQRMLIGRELFEKSA
jgi:hypothetical protein